MPKRVAEVGEGNEDGNGVYGFIRDLIVEGKDARFVNKKGRYIIRWSKALDRYLDFKSKKNPQFKSKRFDRRKASNGLRSALLNFYKKDGAKEYKESKKVNENDEVVERQFQMPPRVFESLFKDVKLPEDGEPDEQDTSSVNSEGETDAHSPPNSSSSDAGFDETMDATFDDTSGIIAVPNNSTILGIPSNPCLNFIKTEEDGDVFLPDTILPSEMFDASAVDSALEEICSDGISDDISEDLDLLGVVQDILPMSGSVKGGYQFNISLTEQLPDDITSGIVQFEGVANVQVQKLNPFTLTGIVPASLQPGDVPVTVLTVAGQRLGMTCFRYIDEMREMVRQMVKDPDLQLRFAICSQEYGFFGADSNVSQVLGPLNMQNQDSSSRTKQQQSLKVLQLLIYTAAETDARQFIEMIFSTSAGRIIFNSYKDKTPLPEDVARANGHEDLAQYLQGVNIRLSKEVSSVVLSNVIDWIEIVKAVQKQASAGQDEPSSRQKCPSPSDDNSSDYFADAETSSCGSFDLDEANQSDTEDRKSSDEGLCTKDAASKEEANQSPATCMEGSSAGIPDQKMKPPGNKVDTGTPRWWHSYSLSGLLSKGWSKSESTSPVPQGTSLDAKDKTDSPTFGRFPGVTFFSGLFDKGGSSGQANEHDTGKPRMSKPKECGQSNHRRSSRKAATGLKYTGVLLACVMVTVLAGLKLGEGYVLHWTVGNGYTRVSKLLLHCGLYVDAPGVFKETPLHVAAKHGFKDLVDMLVQSGGNVNARNFPSQETPLHLAARNGHQYISEFLLIHGSDVTVQNAPWENTPLHLATRYGHSQVVDILLQRGSDVNARNKWQENPLHLAARYGLQYIAETLIQHGSQVNARSDPSQNTPLHLAAKNGHSWVANILLQHGGDVWARNKPLKTTPLHLATQNGHRKVTDILLQHASVVDALTSQETFGRKLWNLLQDTSVHLAGQNGHQYVAECLVQHGGEFNAQNLPLQYTPLHLAAGSSHQWVTTWKSCQCSKSSMARSSYPSSFGGMKHGSRIQNESQISARSHPWQETPLQLMARNGHQHVASSLIQHEGEVNAQNAPWGGSSLHFHAPSSHLTQEKNNSQLLKVLLIRLLSIAGVEKVLRKETPRHLASQNGHKQVVDISMQHGHDAFARNFLRQETLIDLSAQNGHQSDAKSLKQRNQYDVVNTRNMWQETPLHLAAGKKNKLVAQGSAHQENARGPYYFIQINTEEMPQNSSVCYSYHQNPCEVWSCHEISGGHPEERNKNIFSRLLVGDVLLPKVSSSSDRHQQDCTLACSDQCQQTNQTSEDSSVNSSDQYKQSRMKTLKLVRVVEAISIFCFVVACLLWYKYQIRVLAANSSTDPNVSPSPEPLMECPGIESLHMVDLAHTEAVQHDVMEHEADFFTVCNLMKNVNVEELRLERVRSWLDKCLVPEEGVLVLKAGTRISTASKIKLGCPSRQELHDLSVELGAAWKQLGGVLEIPEAKLEMIDEETEYCQTSKKCYNLLLLWKQRKGKLATYRALKAALYAVQRSDLAETFCNETSHALKPSPVMGGSVHLPLDGGSSEAMFKWRKKNPGAASGKSVVVLKRSDDMIPKGKVFMPNTIEMAQLKKPEKGQFKTNVQFSSTMTEMDVSSLLEDIFPFLRDQRIHCDVAVDSRTKLDFQGQLNIWDGLFIRTQALEIEHGHPLGQELHDISLELGVVWKQLVRALQIPEAKLEMIENEYCQASKKWCNLLLLQKHRRGKLATFTAPEAGLHAAQRSAKTILLIAEYLKGISHSW